MVRASYHMPVGNTTRMEAVPRLPVPFEFMYRGDNAQESDARLKEFLMRIAWCDGMLILALILSGPLCIPFVALAGGFFFLLRTMKAVEQKAYRAAIHGVVLILIAVIISYAGAQSEWLMIAMMVYLINAYIWSLTKHWIHRSTVSPMPRSEADRLRKRWKLRVAIHRMIPVLAAMVAWYLHTPGMFPVVLISAALLLIAPTTPGQTFKIVKRAITSYLSYNSAETRVPGVLQSPEGPAVHRQHLLASQIAAFTVLSVLPPLFASASAPSLSIVPISILPGCYFLFIPAVLVASLLKECNDCFAKIQSDESWDSVLTEMRQSDNPILRDSCFKGHVASDGSPLFVPIKIFKEHAHFLGSTGAGKTSKGLLQTQEQLVLAGNCSLVSLDNKADTNETLATLMAANDDLDQRTGRRLPLKVFRLDLHVATHGFNPLICPFWRKLSLNEKVDTLSAAMGMNYGAGYGQRYYTSANERILQEVLRTYPDVDTFKELAERVGYAIRNPKKFDFLPNTAKNADHVHAELRRLADIPQLQITDNDPLYAELANHAIDPTNIFIDPQIVYFHLSSITSASTAPNVARLFIYSLLTAGTLVRNRIPVFLSIDEFQRIISENLEFLLQLARSVDVGLLLANQSMADLRAGRRDLAPTIEMNCRYRQWFDVGSLEDRHRFKDATGETIELLQSTMFSFGTNGSSTTSGSNEVILPRININEMLMISDNPDLSLLRIARGEGYAQFGGFPIVVRSPFHISREEYERRKSMPWPKLPGSFIPSEIQSIATTQRKRPPTVIVQDDSQTEAAPNDLDIKGLFDGLNEQTRKQSPPKKGNDDE